MIPLHLRISGFLSYRDPVELDFDTFDLACISGHNGAGKSSLLDAITWSLFGEARGKSGDVINLHSDVKAAEVQLTFLHEQNTYRVQRTLPRNKSTVLEFQVRTVPLSLEGGDWRPLTEKTTRDTQARIEQTLRLDYETFVNASFFLQGKADQFTQQNAGKRKEVLSNILGLEIWEEYKNRTSDRRKKLESAVDEIDGRIAEIDAELAEENARTSRLRELQSSLDQLSAAREAQESALLSIKQTASLLDEQRKLTITLQSAFERTRAHLVSIEARLAAKELDRASYADLTHRAKEIDAAYKAWQSARKDVEAWDKVASKFYEREKERATLQEKIAVEKARLEEERRSLTMEESEVSKQSNVLRDLEREIAAAKMSLEKSEIIIAKRLELESRRNAAREQQAALRVENETLKLEMNQLRERIESLASAEGAQCPLCGQELTESHRQSTLARLEEEGREKGDRYRANQKATTMIAAQITADEAEIMSLSSAEAERIRFTGEISQLTERKEQLQALARDWDTTGGKRLKEVERLLEAGKYAVDDQTRLAKLDNELSKLGYDVSAHDQAREKERGLRSVEEEYVQLKSAKEAIRQIESEIANLEEEKKKRREEADAGQAEYDLAVSALKEAEARSPNLDEAESELFRLREAENRARGELGGAQQRVDILATQRARKAEFEKQAEELSKQIVQHKTLERAFGRDGIPALLIEQALPQIEEKANELLDRLSDEQMSIRFVTQTGYKDKKREDLKETLDIHIKDSAGLRNYEMYSGGEAFRVNFAIRLALSEVLAQRKGARLQTLVIDEGFGSQDAQGRQRLIEAINLVKKDFAKIIVVTHLDELKDAFPTRIEIEKTERGSALRVN